MYKRVWCTCKVVVLLIKPVALLSFLLPWPLALLQLPIVYPPFWGGVGVVSYQGIVTSTFVHGVGILSTCHLWTFLGGRITTKQKNKKNYLFIKWQQGAKKIIFTACHSGKLKLTFTSPNIISTCSKNVLMSRLISQSFFNLNFSNNITSPKANSNMPRLSDATSLHTGQIAKKKLGLT